MGKTSIGRSVAAIMGRKFHRIALGGIADQSDIRGHRHGSTSNTLYNTVLLCCVLLGVHMLDQCLGEL